jgi:hypothetical protein
VLLLEYKEQIHNGQVKDSELRRWRVERVGDGSRLRHKLRRVDYAARNTERLNTRLSKNYEVTLELNLELGTLFACGGKI